MSDLQTSESDHDRTAPTMSRPVVLLSVIAALAVGFAVGDRLARSDDNNLQVVDTYCSPLITIDQKEALNGGLGLQVQVMEDGSERTRLPRQRSIDTFVIIEGICRTPVPAPSTINTRDIWP